MLVVTILVGLVIGLSLGALGGGGSILTVPALVYLLHQTPHAATTGSLLIVGISALAGMVAHRRAGRVRLGAGLTFGALGVAGSYVGTRLSASVDPNVLLTAFAVLMLVAAGAMVRRRAGGAAGHPPGPAAPPSGPPSPRGDLPALTEPGRSRVVVLERSQPTTTSCPLPSPSARIDACRGLKVVAAATAVGLLTGFFGVGGGFVIVPALVLALGFRMPEAVGTSLLVIAVNSAASLGARIGGHTHLDWPLLGVFTAAAVVGSFAGNRVASRVDAARLTFAFSALLVLIAAYTAARSVPHLL